MDKVRLQSTVSLSTATLVVAASTLLAACQTLPSASRINVELNNPGSHLLLNDTLPVRRDYARSIIQDGEVVNRPDLYTTWCTVHVYRHRADMDKRAEIVADDFVIRRAYKFIDYSASLHGRVQPVQVAQLHLPQSNGPLLIHEEPSNVTFSTVFELASDSQPAVTKMVCSIFDDPRTGHHPTLSDVRETLGEIAQITKGDA